jgi:hypothetical protein
VNVVIPGGATSMDPVSGQAIMMAHVVEVRRVDEARPAVGERKRDQGHPER